MAAKKAAASCTSRPVLGLLLLPPLLLLLLLLLLLRAGVKGMATYEWCVSWVVLVGANLKPRFREWSTDCGTNLGQDPHASRKGGGLS